jgi:hypothetical protein
MSSHKSKLLVDRKLWLRDKDNNLLGIIQIKIWLVDDFRYPDGVDSEAARRLEKRLKELGYL